MSTSKDPGQLRDFRINQSFSSVSQSAPRQETRVRATTLSEWSHPSAFFEDEEQMVEKVDFEIDPSKKSLKSPNPQPIKNIPLNTTHEKTLSGTSYSSSTLLPWVAQLAIQERQMEKQGTVDAPSALNTHEYLKNKTREFLVQLQNEFREKIELFNESRQSPAFQIHIYKVSQAPDDFMLFRYGVKLIISGQKAGRVVFAFNQFLGQVFNSNQNSILELQAATGSLNQIYWTHKGEKVLIEDIVRYFLSEFISQSFK
jgi:hypothetical protein